MPRVNASCDQKHAGKCGTRRARLTKAVQVASLKQMKVNIQMLDRSGYTVSLVFYLSVSSGIAPLMCWEAMPTGARLTACSVKSCAASSLAARIQCKVETRLSVFLHSHCRRVLFNCQTPDAGPDWQSLFLQIANDDSCFHFQKNNDSTIHCGSNSWLD